MLPNLLCASSSSIFVVSWRELPGAASTLTKSVPISSFGTREVLLVLIRYMSAPIATIRIRPAAHLFLMKNVTPCLYFLDMPWNAASNAILNLVENFFGFSPGFTSSLGCRISAHIAGEKVSALTAERPTATAMVRPNWV